MSQMVHQITASIQIVFIITLIAGAGIILIINLLLRKAARNSQEDQGFSEAGIKREDISSYVAFDAIRDGVVALDNYTRFVSAIRIQGYDLFHASTEDQERVMNSYTQLFDMLPDEEYLQIRYNPQHMDLSNYIEDYVNKYDEVSSEIYDKIQTMELIQRKVAKMNKEGTLATAEGILYQDKIISLNKEIESLGSQKRELDELVKYLRSQVSRDSLTEMNATYIFSWTYSKSVEQYNEKLTKEQIMERAEKELRSIAQSYISALGDAHLHAKQITTTEEMVDIWRSYFRPVTGLDFRVADIFNNSSAFDSVVDSERDVSVIPRRQRDGMESSRLAEASNRVVKERKGAL